jgi:glycosyltransferase involved in cell wall biosynthesis
MIIPSALSECRILKILFSSYLFDPSVGGIESVSKILAEKFAAAGNEVHVITQSPGHEIGGANYRVTRRPSISKLFALLNWCDLLFQNNITLRSLIPALLRRKPTLVVHQTWLRNTRGESNWNNRLKRALLPRVTNVAISKAVADSIAGHSFVIGNPYDDSVFHLIPNIARDKDLVFVGRLVSDKGADLLLRALKSLQNENLQPNLMMVSSGPEEDNLRKLTTELSLDRQVTFAGQQSGDLLAEILNQHRILVVPSRWAEPFGIVALEGIACGCVIVGSEKGGLKEAIGPCGLTFENGNVSELAAQLKRLLTEPDLIAKFREGANEHLAKFQPDQVAAAYLRLMRKIAA